ncbi:MAG TPA: aldolase/citrate lyase family protein [Steroidobacteraceae bacterium]
MNTPVSFRQRLLAREPLLGTFIKTPTVQTTEIIGELGFDFVVIDQEHAPFDRVTVDLLILAARAARIAVLVRVPAGEPGSLLSALDSGANGILLPHVATARIARDFVAAARYRNGHRGFSNSPRAGRYGGASIWEHVDACDAQTAVIAMIEDPQALDHVNEIAAVEGLDAFFIGRGDLTVAYGAESPNSDIVRFAVQRISNAARAGSKALCAHVGRLDASEMSWLREQGVSSFIVSSDQGLLRKAGADVLAEFRALTRPADGKNS